MRAKHVAAAPGFGRPLSALLASRCRRRRVAAPLPSAAGENCTRRACGPDVALDVRDRRLLGVASAREGAAGSELCARDASVMSSSFVGRHDARRSCNSEGRALPPTAASSSVTPSPSTRSVTSRLLPTPRAALDGDPRRGAFRVVVTRRRGAWLTLASLQLLPPPTPSSPSPPPLLLVLCVPSCGSSSSITARWLGAGYASSGRGCGGCGIGGCAGNGSGGEDLCVLSGGSASLDVEEVMGGRAVEPPCSFVGGRSLDWTNGCATGASPPTFMSSIAARDRTVSPLTAEVGSSTRRAPLGDGRSWRRRPNSALTFGDNRRFFAFIAFRERARSRAAE